MRAFKGWGGRGLHVQFDEQVRVGCGWLQVTHAMDIRMMAASPSVKAAPDADDCGGAGAGAM